MRKTLIIEISDEKREKFKYKGNDECCQNFEIDIEHFHIIIVSDVSFKSTLPPPPSLPIRLYFD